MKKLLFVLLVSIAAGSSKSQNSLKASPIRYKTTMEIKDPIIVTGMDNNPARINDVKGKAVRDFLLKCGMAEKIHWFIKKNGYVVYYSVQGKKGFRFYDAKGNLAYNMLTYGEESLPLEIRDLVKRTYYMDYTINVAEEVQTNNKIIYVVHISDAKTIKTISIADGEINVLEDLIKSN